MNLDSLVDQAKNKFDLTDAAHQQSLYTLADSLLMSDLSLDKIKRIALEEKTPLEFRIAAKLVESKLIVQKLRQQVHLGIVFAMWGEHNRLYPKTEDNPYGEDALRVKLDQLTWICQNSPVSWTLYAVDDGCPHNSGKIAAEIAAAHPLKDSVKVLFLEDAIPADTGGLSRLQSVDDSRKGGAVILGAMQALEDGVDALIYTDADNSVHLGQIGLLLDPWINRQIPVVLGNRKHPEAVLVKQEARWGIGIKVLRHMQRMIGQAIFSRDILDTQAAFKLYDKEVLRQIIQNPTVYDFSFDTDWILAVLAMDKAFAQVPFAFIDSAAESASITQGPMTTWETLLKGLTRAVRKHGMPHNEDMARVIDEEIHSSSDLDLLINHLPEELQNASDGDLGNPEVMSPAAIQTWMKQVKARA
jgi:hypothetical protein